MVLMDNPRFYVDEFPDCFVIKEATSFPPMRLIGTLTKAKGWSREMVEEVLEMVRKAARSV